MFVIPGQIKGNLRLSHNMYHEICYSIFFLLYYFSYLIKKWKYYTLNIPNLYYLINFLNEEIVLFIKPLMLPSFYASTNIFVKWENKMWIHICKNGFLFSILNCFVVQSEDVHYPSLLHNLFTPTHKKFIFKDDNN